MIVLGLHGVFVEIQISTFVTLQVFFFFFQYACNHFGDKVKNY